MNIVIDKLKERLGNININSRVDFADELREITQELVLLGLKEAGIFNKASFQGGTVLRLFYKTKRYSEDLDFVLDKIDNTFTWKPYLEIVKDFVANYGCLFEISDKSKKESIVKKAFIKDSSIEQMMNISWNMRNGTPQRVKIKLEMDTNPPLYSENEIKKYNFPYEYEVKIQKLSSLFAGKCHALLCREYEKGRDWFDFQWFVNKGIEPNYKYLEAMLAQQGFYKELASKKLIEINKLWLCNELTKKCEMINYDNINKDIRKFTKNNPEFNTEKKDIVKFINIINSDKYGINISNGKKM